MIATTLPEGWYTTTADGTAHHAYELIGAAVRPACAGDETDSSGIRETDIGDRICDACLEALRIGGATIALPRDLGRCLGCGLLQHVVDPARIATHHRIPSDEVCTGSNVRPAGFDGRDTARRHALTQHTELRVEIEDFRRAVAEAIDCGFRFNRMTDQFTAIMQMEGQLPFWEALVGSGDYLAVAGTAMHILTGGTYPKNGDEHLDRAVQVSAARRWLKANRVEIDRVIREDEEAAAVLLEAVLPAA